MNKKIIGYLLASSLAVVLFLLVFYVWFLTRQDLIQRGLASYKFPYLRYSQEEQKKLFPSYTNNVVVTKQSPEQTHRIFINYLNNDEIHKAVECCVIPQNKEKTVEFILNVKSRGFLKAMISDIEKIKLEYMQDSIATYTFTGSVGNSKKTGFIEFIKDKNGIWLIKQL